MSSAAVAGGTGPEPMNRFLLLIGVVCFKAIVDVCVMVVIARYVARP